MRIEDTPAYCPICFKLCPNDTETEKCIKSHKKNYINNEKGGLTG